jgi:hypothetical protein
MHSKGNYERNAENRVERCRLDDHESDGIICARIILSHDLLHALSHDEQAMRHENSIKHSVPDLDAKVGKLGDVVVK